MIIRFLVHPGWGVYPGLTAGDGHSSPLDAAAMMGGEPEEWELEEIEAESLETVRLIEPDGQGGYTISYGNMIEIDGLTATLTRGWVSGAKVTEGDAHVFDSPAQDTAIALDVVEDDATGEIVLQPYTWNPDAETKADPPEGYFVLWADILRGILPAGASSLNQLQEEG